MRMASSAPCPFWYARCRGGDGQLSHIYEDGCYSPGGGGGTEGYEDQKMDSVKARESRHVGLARRYNLMNILSSFGSVLSCSTSH